MNIENITIGQEFKDLKELCKIIDIEYKDSTNSRKKVIKEMDRFFEYEKQGRKYIIKKIYDTPKQKIDNRVNNGQNEGSHSHNNIYKKYVDPILQNYFYNYINVKNEDGYTKNENNIYTTTNILAKEIKIINENYMIGYENKDALFLYVKKNIGLATNTPIFDIYSKTKNSIKNVIASSLSRLQKEEMIEFTNCYFLKYWQGAIRPATEEEEETIKMIQNNVMKEMCIIDKKILYINDKLRKEYYKKCEEQVINTFKKNDEEIYYEEIAKESNTDENGYFDNSKFCIGDCEGYYAGYNILINKNIHDTSIDIKTYKKELNKTMLEQTYKKCEYTHTKERNAPRFGLKAKKMTQWRVNRMSSKYLEGCKNVIDVIIKADAKNISVDIKKIKESLQDK